MVTWSNGRTGRDIINHPRNSLLNPVFRWGSSARSISCTIMKATDFVGKLRDTETEKAIANELSSLSEADSFQFVIDMLGVNEVVALELASKCLRTKGYFIDLLKKGLHDANASTIRRWLECVCPRLGVRRVIEYCVAQLDEEPNGVARAIYFLPSFIEQDDRRSKAKLEHLRELAMDQGVLRKPKMSCDEAGQVTFEPME